MSDVPNDLLYTEEHEWVRVEAGEDTLVTIGITDYAQDKMGDVVMVELPEVGDSVSTGAAIGAIESPKSVSDVFSPVGGEVAAVNEELEDAPEFVNDEPYGDGWIVRITVSDVSELKGLLSPEAYTAFCAEQDED
jgi:glycine cleavage system H protein